MLELKGKYNTAKGSYRERNRNAEQPYWFAAG